MIADQYPHAIDFAVYAHLQADDPAAAKALLINRDDHPDVETAVGSANARVVVAARVPLDNGDGEASAALCADMNPANSWEWFPQTVAIRWYAKGIGAARSGELAATEAALGQLEKLVEVMTARELRYWLALLEPLAKPSGDGARCRMVKAIWRSN